MRGDYLAAVLATGVCPKCNQDVGADDIDERYSYGVYAGVMCTKCAKEGFRDQCGLGEQGQGSPSELEEMGEQYWEDE